MIDPEGHMPEREALAAEYVLGTLPLAERLMAEALIESDANFAAQVEAWREKLAPLNDGYTDAPPPPDMLNRIEARLFPEPERTTRRGWLWGAIAAAALAAIAVLAVLPNLAPDDAVVATLTSEGQPLVVAARFDPEDGALIVNRSAGPPAGAGQDYELWLIPEGQGAVSIGLVRDETLTIPLDALPEGTTLAVTLEPEGGSPTGTATGPILVAAVIGGEGS